jgi:phosphate starvation-inducible PhoH-like protein
MNQKLYLDLLNQKDVIFATGSAGTGKTWVAVGFAINELKKNRIKRLVITRPAVEAGEKLGFLPGDLKEKVDPYLIPIYDAIYEFLGREHAEKMIEKGIIEIAPLAYMRGRTLDNAIIILDEGQNTTRNQMLMALTRLGFNSKMIVTGDITQIDLPKTSMSGLVEAVKLLSGIKQIGLIHFDKSDVMRHPIVTRIIAKYEELDNDQD